MRRHEHGRDQREAAKAETSGVRAEPAGRLQQVLKLQLLVGNAAVTDLLNGDRVEPRGVVRHEREARTAAGRMPMSGNASSDGKTAVQSRQASIQRQVSHDESGGQAALDAAVERGLDWWEYPESKGRAKAVFEDVLGMSVDSRAFDTAWERAREALQNPIVSPLTDPNARAETADRLIHLHPRQYRDLLEMVESVKGYEDNPVSLIDKLMLHEALHVVGQELGTTEDQDHDDIVPKLLNW